LPEYESFTGDAMQQLVTSKQLWKQFGQLSPSQQKEVAIFIESLLTAETPKVRRDRRPLLQLSVWSKDDIARIDL
jgi:hypothetical protein